MGAHRKKNTNALKYGVMVEGVLTSRGEKCVYRDRCPSSALKLCVVGEACPFETARLGAFVESAGSTFEYATSFVDPSEVRRTILELGVVALQIDRLTARMQREGFVTSSGGFVRPTLSVGRYATALHRRQLRLLTRLLDEETATHWGLN